MIGLDQGQQSGWGIALERSPVVRHGLAKTAADRLAAVQLALEYAGGDPKWLWAMFEKHDHMPSDRLTTHDRHTVRRHSRQGAPERSNQTLIGMGKNYGRWLEQLALIGMPETHVLEVRPTSWRARVHGVTKGDDEKVKGAAVTWAGNHVGAPVPNHNHAEGVCITYWAAFDGFAMYDVHKAHDRMKAADKRGVKKQLELGAVEPANDNGVGRSG